MFIEFREARKVGSYWGDLMPIMTCEELGELIQAISKYERASQTNSDNLSGCKLDLEDELADVIISITALGELYHVDWDRVDNKMREKLAIEYEDKPRIEETADVSDLRLPARAHHGLLRYGCRTVSDVVKVYNSNEILNIRYVGPKTKEIVRQALIDFGIPEEELA